ncbi:hypothetical protein B0H66DRAFT_171734 [Apodospora peruviana]|uniref:Uncharacterized protein n=1 Tax=Apodospora peruviana TaxID=516989 RepID=A0AAE0HRZ9_9PEZI|nr:hypothetical protein B0H66DRAFT_171734 [Apodospora peruviana]
MGGLWNVETRAFPPTGGDKSGLGLVIWDLLVMICLAICNRCMYMGQASSRGTLRLLHVAIALLSVWFFLHCLDLFIHQFRAPVRYSYIIAPAIFDIFRFLSDVLIIPGFWLALQRYQRPDVPQFPVIEEDKDALVMCTLVWILGIYQIGLNFSFSFAWLGFADLAAIDRIAKSRSAFHVAFAALYFFVTIFVVVTSLEHGIRKRRAVALVVLPKSTLDSLEDSRYLMNTALIALLFRSFCELVIVGQIDRSPENLVQVYVARDVCYGLFSAAMSYFVLAATPMKWHKKEDPWEADKMENERLKQIARNEAVATCLAVEAAMVKWVPELESIFLDKIAEATRDGSTTGPPIGVIMDGLGDKVEHDFANRHQSGLVGAVKMATDATPPESDFDMRLKDAKLEYIELLRARYKDWDPIFKWGENSSVNTS